MHRELKETALLRILHDLCWTKEVPPGLEPSAVIDNKVVQFWIDGHGMRVRSIRISNTRYVWHDMYVREITDESLDNLLNQLHPEFDLETWQLYYELKNE